MFIISPYAFTLIGPSLAKVPDEKPFVNALPTNAAANVPTIFCLLLITFDSNDFNPAAISPFSICCAAAAAPVDCAKLNAVPASIAEMLKLFFALRLGALRLGAIKPY
jgi:hypothetical protein